jgi:TonB-linked SusC/RagA family outer membrane protein
LSIKVVLLTSFFDFWHWLIQINLNMKTKLNGILTLLLALVVQVAFAQQTVTGKVTGPDGDNVLGATVSIKGTSTFASTDFDGNYSIEASTESVLVFSYTGYDTQEITVGNQTVIDVKFSNNALDTVVIVAYGSQKRDQLTSSISIVKSERIEQVPIASLDQALQGAAPGLNVATGSGQPGRVGDVIIRGRGSLNGDVNPLYVIDGVPTDERGFRSLNSNDVENISILKDAAATAPYGNRAANGVILITTKRGAYDSPLSVQYRSLTGFSEANPAQFNVMDAQQYLTFSRDLLGGGPNGGFNDAEIAAFGTANWADVLQRTGSTQSHEVNFSQGTKTTRSYTSIGFFKQEGITRRSDLQRFTFRNNYSNKSSERFEYNTQVTLNYSTSDFVVDRDRDSGVFGANSGGQLDNPFIVPFLALPHLNPFNPDGSVNIIGTQLSGALNPDGSLNTGGINGFRNTPFLTLNTQALNTDRESELKAIATGDATYKINDNFKLGSRLGVDYTAIEELNIDAPGSHRGFLSPDPNAQFGKGQQTEAYIRRFIANVNPYLRYEQDFGKHGVSASVNTEYNYQNFQTSFFQAFGLNPNLPGSGSGFTAGNINPLYAPNVGSSESELALFSAFVLANYDYDGRFGLNVNVRRDGSSRFSEENRWGTFYSVGARWNLHNEDFMADQEIFNTLKLRASYGKVGNQNIGGAYVGTERVSIITGYQGAPGSVPTSLVADDLTWENTYVTNIGIDFGIFEDRLNGSIDVYDRQTDNLFFGSPVSLSSGFTAVTRNVAGLNNRGVEIGLSGDVIRNDDLTVNLFVNAAFNRNQVTSLSGENEVVDDTAYTSLTVGESSQAFYLVDWVGVNPANGNPLYRDLDGNLTESYNADNRKFSDKSADPSWVGGFGTNIAYKGFSLNTLFSFQTDRYRQNGSFGLLEDTTLATISNMSTTVLDAWQQPGDITTQPRVGTISTRNLSTTRYIEDASFLRLRNITLSYNLQSNALDKIKFIKALRVYAQGTNLVTWSKWRGFDPESTSNTSFFDYPVARQYTFGLDITI